MMIVWDDCPFYDRISGIKNLRIMCENSKIKKQDIEQMASKHISKEVLERKVETYSYGQRKKLALVLQELLAPKILIMDEISNGLDYDAMKQLKDNIASIAKKKSVILTGHQFGFYEGLVEEIYVVESNIIKNVTKEYDVEDGGLGKIYERYFKDE